MSSAAQLRGEDGRERLGALVDRLAEAGYPVEEAQTRLAISDMTCASCVGQVERVLARQPGVLEASVNLATQGATIRHLTIDGPDAQLALVLTLPVFVLEMGGHMIPAFHHWVHEVIGIWNSWVLRFVLASLVLFGPGLIFFLNGIPALLRGAPDMNSLVAVGTLAA